MFNLSYIWWCIKTFFEKKEPKFGANIIRHRTWLEREIQEQLIERDNSFILKPSDNWYDKYL